MHTLVEELLGNQRIKKGCVCVVRQLGIGLISKTHLWILFLCPLVTQNPLTSRLATGIISFSTCKVKIKLVP